MYKHKYHKYKSKYFKLKFGTISDNSHDEITEDIDVIKKLFPPLDDEEKYKLLKIDVPSTTYISKEIAASKITSIIIKNLDSDPNLSIITDANGGSGGNTLSFAQYFKKVYAIELDKDRSEYLINNIKVYGFNNVKVINGDSVKEIKLIKDHDIIFFDPPWGGSDYKKHKRLRLCMGSQSMEDICLDALNKNKMTKVPKIICLKLPLNYDTKYFHHKLKDHKIKYYKLKRMLIIIVFN